MVWSRILARLPRRIKYLFFLFSHFCLSFLINPEVDESSDIITYIGIPLAVLGVLPILYPTINSLVTIHEVKQSLRHNGLFEATTRSGLMSGIMEVTLPILSITPLDREEDAEY